MPGMNDPIQERVALLVGIDKASYRKSRNTLSELFKERKVLEIEGDVSGLSDTIRDAIRGAGKDIDASLLKRFDDDMGELLIKFGKIREDSIKASASGNEDLMEALKLQQQNVEAEMEAAAEAHKQRSQAAKELKEALTPNVPKFRDAAEAFTDTFGDSLGNLKSGDVAGFAKALSGALGKGLSKGADLKQAQAAASASKEGAAALKATAGQLAAMAAGLAAVTAVAVALVGVMVMADGQAKELNSTILEGAGMADVALTGVGSKLGDVTDGLEEARSAAFELAFEFRSTPKEMTEIISTLNQAGFTLKEMRDQAGGVSEAIRTTFVHSKALGISVGETAQVMNEWTADFGMGLAEIGERFSAIEGLAMRSGMGTKRFFTAVSQATSGMALYNIRMEEAAGLLLTTSKVLGDTDASDFIKSLTKGFADESYVDRFKRIMISGIGDVHKIMAKDATGMARNFSRSFKENANVQDAFKGAIKDFDVKLLGDPEALKKQLGKMTEKDVQKLVQQLRVNGEDAAAREIEKTDKLLRASKAGVAETAKGLDQLSMGGKLAVKMQGLGNKRISQMSGIELAAFEQYAGISGEQLEQLRLVDANLVGEWDAVSEMSKTVKAGGKLDERQLKALKEYGVTVDEQGQVHDANGDTLGDIDDYTMKSAGRLEEAAKLQTEASFYAHSTMQNTRSITDQLSTGVQYMLERIYEIMTALYGAYRGMTAEQLKAQQDALDLNGKEQEALRTTLEKTNADILAQQQVLQTKGTETDEGKAAAVALAELEKRRSRVSSELAVARGTGEAITELSPTDFETVKGALNNAAATFQASDEGVAELAKQIGGSESKVRAEIAAAATKASEEEAPSWMLSLLGPTAHMGPLANIGLAGREDKAGAVFQKDLAERLMDAKEEADAQSAEQAKRDAALKIAVEQGGADAKSQLEWFRKSSGFADATEESFKAALRRSHAEEEVRNAGITGDEATKLVDDAVSNDGMAAAAAWKKIEDAKKKGGPPVAGDFIMRPGQSAQRFSSADTVVGMKEGGPLASMGGGGGGNVHVTINGGDQSKVYATVKSALKNSGLRP